MTNDQISAGRTDIYLFIYFYFSWEGKLRKMWNSDSQMSASPPPSCLPLALLVLLEVITTVSGQTWQSISFGVSYLPVGGSGNMTGDVFLGYAGYSVHLDWSNNWVYELHKAKLATLGVAHLYSIQGPNDPLYVNYEIGNIALVNHLLKYAANVKRIFLVAHSSGAYVAHELLSQLYVSGMDAGLVTAGKIRYYNLDGGTLRLTSAMVNKLQALYGVYVVSGSGESSNADSMRSMVELYSLASEIVIAGEEYLDFLLEKE
jgi:hypothetical protein